MSLFTKSFWIATVERAIRTAAQATALAITGGIIAGAGGDAVVNAFLLDWTTLAGTFLGGFLLAVLTAVGVGAATSNSSPSITNAEVLTVPDGTGRRRLETKE